LLRNKSTFFDALRAGQKVFGRFLDALKGWSENFLLLRNKSVFVTRARRPKTLSSPGHSSGFKQTRPIGPCTNICYRATRAFYIRPLH